MLEAVCQKCGDTFNPHSEDPEGLIHVVHWTGKDDCDPNGEQVECGGQGVVTGEWI